MVAATDETTAEPELNALTVVMNDLIAAYKKNKLNPMSAWTVRVNVDGTTDIVNGMDYMLGYDIPAGAARIPPETFIEYDPVDPETVDPSESGDMTAWTSVIETREQLPADVLPGSDKTAVVPLVRLFDGEDAEDE